MKRSPALLTAVDVARLCHVDLKTIHNWADKSKLLGTRTEGRHLRFRRIVVLEFLRTYGHPIPASLLAHRARVCLTGATASLALRRTLARKHDVVAVEEPFDAIVSIASIDPDILVFDDLPWLVAARAIERLCAVDATKHVRVVVTSDDAERRDAALRAGATSAVPRDDAAVRAAIDRIAQGR